VLWRLLDSVRSVLAIGALLLGVAELVQAPPERDERDERPALQAAALGQLAHEGAPMDDEHGEEKALPLALGPHEEQPAWEDLGGRASELTAALGRAREAYEARRQRPPALASRISAPGAP
jgi:hypothetical protein